MLSAELLPPAVLIGTLRYLQVEGKVQLCLWYGLSGNLTSPPPCLWAAIHWDHDYCLVAHWHVPT